MPHFKKIFIATTFLLSMIHGVVSALDPSDDPLANYAAEKVSENTWVVHGPLKKIKKITDKPITHVFISHVHGDHWLGNQAIKAAYPDAKFYAHPQMIEAANDGEADNWVALMENLTEGATKGTEAIVPDIALSDRQEIKIDNITVRGNIASIEKALETEVEIVVPGHGPTGGKEILGIFKSYLQTIYEASEQAVEDDKEPYEVKAELLPSMDAYHKWSGFEGEFGRHISQAMLEAEDANF